MPTPALVLTNQNVQVDKVDPHNMKPLERVFYWNDHIMPENNAISKFKYDSKLAAKMRTLGFGVVNSHIMDGIARGTGVLVALNDDEGDANRIIEDASGQFFFFFKKCSK